MSVTVLDAQGLKCPLPVLRAKKLLKEVPAGGLLRVLATDPGAPKDFEHFCDATGCELVESTQDGALFTLVIRKQA